jgi:hypothetical protein
MPPCCATYERQAGELMEESVAVRLGVRQGWNWGWSIDWPMTPLPLSAYIGYPPYCIHHLISFISSRSCQSQHATTAGSSHFHTPPFIRLERTQRNGRPSHELPAAPAPHHTSHILCSTCGAKFKTTRCVHIASAHHVFMWSFFTSQAPTSMMERRIEGARRS